MSQIFNVPGDSFEEDSEEYVRYKRIEVVVDKATSDFLIRADWEANMECCDMINGCLNSRIIDEIVFLLRRKLGSLSTPLTPAPIRQVSLTLSLVESLVKNCGTRLHKAINNVAFMKEMQNVAHRHVNKDGKDH